MGKYCWRIYASYSTANCDDKAVAVLNRKAVLEFGEQRCELLSTIDNPHIVKYSHV